MISKVAHPAEIRPLGAIVSTIVLHTMHAPAAHDEFDVTACWELLVEHSVSTHYFVGRAGEIVTMTPEDRVAIHAGVAVGALPFVGLEKPCDLTGRLNTTSIGIECLASPQSGLTEEQYRALGNLIEAICRRHPIKFVVGHYHIAPGRKTDPWQFQWDKLRDELSPQLLRKIFVMIK